MRYRLRTLLIAVLLLAVLANAIASERRASKQVLELDAAVLAALEKLNPEVSERFDIDYLNEPINKLLVYNMLTAKSGGTFLSGPRRILRTLQPGDQADVSIKIEAPWYFFSYRTPEILIDFSSSRGNRWLAKRLEAELFASDGVKPRVSTP